MDRITPKFTMVETVVALGVLLLSLSVVFSTIAASQQRVMKAEKKWHRQHMLTQATEYFLLAPPGVTIPKTVFPFDEYQASCEYSPPQGLPDMTETQLGNWQLTAMKIVIKSTNDGQTVASITLDRIIKVDDQ